MPATQKVVEFEGLSFDVTPHEEPDPVYFTDQRPEFDVTITNEDSKYEWADDSCFRWQIEIDGRPVHEGIEYFGPLDFGESETVRVGGKVLAFEGHAVLNISAGGASGNDDSDRWSLRAGNSREMDPGYTCRVWDKSHYDAQIRRPERLQKGIILTSLVLICFAIIQLVVVLLPYL